MGRFSRSMALAKASWRTLKADRELLALPVFSFVMSLVVLSIGLGLVFLIDYDSNLGISDFELSTGGIIVLAVAGMALSIVATFFQAAMVGGARERLTGGDPTVGSALAVASSRLGVIVPWALFSWCWNLWCWLSSTISRKVCCAAWTNASGSPGAASRALLAPPNNKQKAKKKYLVAKRNCVIVTSIKK